MKRAGRAAGMALLVFRADKMASLTEGQWTEGEPWELDCRCHFQMGEVNGAGKEQCCVCAYVCLTALRWARSFGD